MTSTMTGGGRLGNQIIRNLAVSLIANKFNLRVHYKNLKLIEEIGISLFNGEKTHKTTIALTDLNWLSILNQTELCANLNPNDNYFQTREITNILYAYLNSDIAKSEIISKNPFLIRYNANNDCCIHIRLSDATQWAPTIDYYLNALGKLQFDNLFITTDSEHHPYIKAIQRTFPASTVLHMNEVSTIQFASTCKHIILSHGSFSAVIGYLSFFSTVYFPAYSLASTQWFGDMFSIDGWIELM